MGPTTTMQKRTLLPHGRLQLACSPEQQEALAVAICVGQFMWWGNQLYKAVYAVISCQGSPLDLVPCVPVPLPSGVSHIFMGPDRWGGFGRL